MGRFFKISIRTKIIFIITAVSAVTVGLSLTFSLINYSSLIKNKLRSEIKQTALIIGEYCIAPNDSGFSTSTKKILGDYSENKNIQCIGIYSVDGALFVSRQKDRRKLPEKIQFNNHEVIFNGNEATFIGPIIHNSKNYGGIFLVYYTGLTKDIFNKAIVAQVAFLIIVVISFLLALYFQKFISQPILELAEKVSKISRSKNFQVSLDSNSNDEIGYLYENFNQMLRTVHKRELERDKAIQAFMEGEQKYRNIFNYSLNGILLSDKEGRISDANENACRIFEIEHNEIIRKNIQDIIPGKYLKKYDELLAIIGKKGKHSFITPLLSKSGQEITLEFSSIIIDFDGKEIILSFFSNITNQLKATEKLRESELRYKTLVENFPGAMVLHSNNSILFANNAIHTILGGPIEIDFIGKNILSFVDFKYHEKLNNQFVNVLETDKASAVLEAEMIKQSGEYLVSEIISIPLYFDKKKSILTVFSDVTQRKQVENELIVAKEKAEESDKLKSAFLANMSHEIRTPMNGIIGFVDLLGKDGITEADIKRYVKVIKISAERLLAIINDIIDISKIEAGAVNVYNSYFSLNMLLVEIEQFYRPQIEKKGLLFSTSIQILPEIALYSDKTKLQQVISNLLSNSLKFTTTGTIELACVLKEKEEVVEVMVKDTGVGIPKSQQKMIFERFRQANNFIIDFNEGTGLGLSISKGFAEALGGSIRVMSEEGQGSCFIIKLPVRKPNLKKYPLRRQIYEDLNIPDFSQYTLAIIENEIVNLEYLLEVLKPTRATILSVQDGSKAFQFIMDHPEIDLVLFDIHQDKIDGFDLAKKISNIQSNLPIIAQTVYNLEVDRKKAIESGCCDFINKPILPDILYQLLVKYLKNN